jgi:gliding motility-associated-like protein
MKKALLFLCILFAFNYSNAQGPCIGSSSISITPPPDPISGCYFPGTTVTVCVTINDYLQTNADWLCGVVPILGPGWDTTTLQPVSAPPSCDGLGVWGWFGSCTGFAGNTYGPGFYYDSELNSPNGTIDSIPGNNYGDNCAVNTWIFCFQVTTNAIITAGVNSFIGVNALPDYEAGNWGSSGCVDPIISNNNCVSPNCTVTVPTVTVTNTLCFGDTTGTASVTPTSGYPPYSYLWSNGQTTQSISGISGGIYSVIVTDSVGCQKTVYLQVQQPQDINFNPFVQNIGCVAGGTGSITTNVTGGTAPYNYLWSTTATTSSLSGLSVGTYTLTVTDSAGCVKTNTFNLISVPPLSVPFTSTNAICGGNNGSITVTPTGTPPYSYQWTPAVSATNSATALAAGTYYVQVTDSNGCMLTDTITISSIATFSLSSSVAPLGCDSLAGGSATVIVSPPGTYTYQWLPSGGTNATASGLPSGTYTCIVTDSNSCVDSVTVLILPVIPITFAQSSTNVLCNTNNTGTASLTNVNGGTPPYSYLWSDNSTGSSINSVAAGVYTFTITDANSCTTTGTVTVIQNPSIQLSLSPDTSICAGQSLTISTNASGGTPGFNYNWSNGATTSSQQVNPASTTPYTVTVTDVTGCTAMATVNITVDQYPVISIAGDTSICYGTSTVITASGGTNYTWSTSVGLSDSTIANPTATPLTTTSYSVTASNGNCSASSSVTVTVASPINASFTPDTTQGSPPLTVHFTDNSTGATSWSWNFGDGNTDNTQNPTHQFADTGTYTVILLVTNAEGCTDTATFKIIIEQNSSLIIPNIFTPNSDNFNDVFQLQEKNIASVKFEIFNRWGTKIHEWNQLNGTWDGKMANGDPAPEGTYFYLIHALGTDSTIYDRSGTITLLRKNKK